MKTSSSSMASLHVSSSSPPPPASSGSDQPPRIIEINEYAPVRASEIEQFPNPNNSDESAIPSNNLKSKHYKLLLGINYGCLFIGSLASTLISKYYFIHRGSSRWVSTWVQSAGFPLLLLPIYLPHYLLHSTARKPFTGFTKNIFLLSMVVGIFLGINNFLVSWGNSYLPVSTSSLLLSSQLAFNLILSVLIVNQKVQFNNLNCVVLLTLSSLLVALTSSNDRPPGLTHGKYLLGFFCTLGAGLMFALYLPLMEMIYRRVYCYAMVVEMQLIMEVAATGFAMVGMGVAGGFREMRKEADGGFDKGGVVYWWVIVGNMMTWQMCFLGTAGMVFLTTSLTGGICMTALLGLNVVGGVVVYGDRFGGVKAVATVMCIWGFCSYLYGMYVDSLEKKHHHRLRGCATTSASSSSSISDNSNAPVMPTTQLSCTSSCVHVKNIASKLFKG